MRKRHLPNDDHDTNCLTPPPSPTSFDQIDPTLDNQPQVTGSTGPKRDNESDVDEQTVIDLTDKVDKFLTECHEELSKAPCKTLSISQVLLIQTLTQLKVSITTPPILHC